MLKAACVVGPIIHSLRLTTDDDEEEEETPFTSVELSREYIEYSQS